MKDKQIQVDRKFEWFLFGIFCVSITIVAYFHEPWLDEAQAWQIAKCADYKTILFNITHYEGHPPLWFLLLSLPAKTGIPYEIGLKSVALLFAGVSTWLILFRSPFPRLIRCLLPFHYFIFYQYGVISRPYGMMGMLFLLSACWFRKKDEKPLAFVITLALQCLLSAYGIVIAGGIAAAWLWDILTEKNWRITSKFFWKDKRILMLMFLLGIAIFSMIDILPREDTVKEFAKIGTNLFSCFVYVFFIALPDSTILTVLKGEGILRYIRFTPGEMLFGVLIGIIMMLSLLLFSSKRKIKYLVLPYLAWTVFATYVYLAVHHIGISFLLILFWLWINYDDSEKAWLWKKLIEYLGINRKKEEAKSFRSINYCRLGKCLGLLTLIVPIFWTIMAGIYEISCPYYYAKGVAEYIRANGLEDAKIMCEWAGSNIDNKEEACKSMNVNVMKMAVSIAPYFEDNIFVNLGDKEKERAYVTFLVADEEANRKELAKWADNGLPDVIIGNVNLSLIFDDLEAKNLYSEAYSISPLQFGIWKMLRTVNPFDSKKIYVRKELLDQSELKPCMEE